MWDRVRTHWRQRNDSNAIPAGIHIRLSCLKPFGLMQICSRQICAGIQTTWMFLGPPSMALDTRFPAGMTNYLCITMKAPAW